MKLLDLSGNAFLFVWILKPSKKSIERDFFPCEIDTFILTMRARICEKIIHINALAVSEVFHLRYEQAFSKIV